jgi:hypothetical protein
VCHDMQDFLIQIADSEALFQPHKQIRLDLYGTMWVNELLSSIIPIILMEPIVLTSINRTEAPVWAEFVCCLKVVSFINRKWLISKEHN